MHRFYLPPEQCQGSLLTLDGREAHHGLHVLRLRREEKLLVLDGAGREFLCEVRELTRHKIQLTPLDKKFVAPLPYRITLVQAIPKGKIFESIIQKATELGVARIIPLLSERVTSHLDEENAEAKAEKWQLTAIEAIKQCGSPWLPKVDAPVSPKDFLARAEVFDLALIGSLQTETRHARAWFQAYQEERKRLPHTLCVWVGPEGDFTPEEIRAAQNAGALPITLGRLVLRSETAAVYCLSILNYEMQFRLQASP